MTPGYLLPEEHPDVKLLTEEECWESLAAAPFGRLAVTAPDGVDIFPVNFAVHQKALYFRSAPGSKLVDIAHASAVAMEVDGSLGRGHWSVVVRGTAARLNHEQEIRESGVASLATLTTSEKWNYVRITPTAIAGRRYTSMAR